MVHEATGYVTRTAECRLLASEPGCQGGGTGALAVSVQNVAQRPEREPPKTMCVPSPKRTEESSSDESGRFPSGPKRSSLSRGGSGESSKEGELLELREQATSSSPRMNLIRVERRCRVSALGRRSSSAELVDLLPPLYLYKSSGKVVLERSEVGKSCLRKYGTSFAENRKNERAHYFTRNRTRGLDCSPFSSLAWEVLTIVARCFHAHC